MAEYIRRDDILDYAHNLRPCEMDFFNCGFTETKILEKKIEIADEIEKLPFVEIEDHDTLKDSHEKILQELKAAGRKCVELSSIAWGLNQDENTRTAFSQKVASYILDVIQTLSFLTGKYEEEKQADKKEE